MPRFTALDWIAEERIARAIAAGELANLPGEGKPLDLDDDLMVPEEMRIVTRVLKNAGFVPPEIAQIREMRELEALVQRQSGEERTRTELKLLMLRTRIEAAGFRHTAAFDQYADKIRDTLKRRSFGKDW